MRHGLFTKGLSRIQRLSLPRPGVGFNVIGGGGGTPPPGYTLSWFDEMNAYSISDPGAVSEGDHEWVPYWFGWGVRHLAGNNDESARYADFEIPNSASTVNQLLTAEGTYTATYGNFMHDFTPSGTMLGRSYKTPATLVTSFYGFPYISWMISTERTNNIGYGYWEVRFRQVNTFAGVHLSVWLLADDLSYPPEIDILEIIGNEPHRWYTNQITSGGSTFQEQANIDPTAWHILGFERTATQMKWYMDGAVVRTSANLISPPDKALYFLMECEIGGDWEGDPAVDAPWPAVIEVDYVRIYT